MPHPVLPTTTFWVSRFEGVRNHNWEKMRKKWPAPYEGRPGIALSPNQRDDSRIHFLINHLKRSMITFCTDFLQMGS